MKLRIDSKRANGRRRRGRGTSLWNILTGRWGRQHRLPAHVTGESDWEVEVPQIRMSRAFAVMLVLHVVAVGGLFAFRIWGRDDKEKVREAADNSTAAALIEPAPEAVLAPAANPEAAGPAEPAKTYSWHPGDTLPLVAARFGVSMNALREANPARLLQPGTEWVIPRAGRVIGGADTGGSDSQPSEIYDPAKAEIAGGPPPPRAVIVPELSPEIPDVIPSPAGESEKPVVKKVSTGTPPKSGTPKSGEAAAAKKKPASAGKPVITEAETPPARTAGTRTHVVTKGDTVFNVAKRYGISPDDVAKANSLDGTYHIRMGQQLRIPVKR